ncbi:hypothetical protein [Taylorella equigenitalis]|uniref:hypothetical protein n=1 Tax=Taylorella equigenitalis TaxID=29575 RepID=UPI0023AEC0BB|nr:hypothetical protein [Taylorella equigenitalis]WEE00249.1 hypothetical protein PZB79_06670 [Taylorella equigenitalis]WEE01726.1 hypothetical protein PZB80_06675 [Taylorella equigenitalis]WFD79741.1 hypothetical protein P7C94_06680 [Taylorella equigenitalis]WFD81217.1 hypothetical protein P7C86_06685 [Taylorella equigenitalis]WFD82696.1 hypothetical protein P7C87_06675 [Taylorella equigenitalis]
MDCETRYEYNPAGRIETRIDALNHEVGYRYDVLGRLSNLIKTVRLDGKEVDYLIYGSGHLHGMLLDKERIVDYEREQIDSK